MALCFAYYEWKRHCWAFTMLIKLFLNFRLNYSGALTYEYNPFLDGARNSNY